MTDKQEAAIGQIVRHYTYDQQRDVAELLELFPDLRHNENQYYGNRRAKKCVKFCSRASGLTTVNG